MPALLPPTMCRMPSPTTISRRELEWETTACCCYSVYSRFPPYGVSVRCQWKKSLSHSTARSTMNTPPENGNAPENRIHPECIPWGVPFQSRVRSDMKPVRASTTSPGGLPPSPRSIPRRLPHFRRGDVEVITYPEKGGGGGFILRCFGKYFPNLAKQVYQGVFPTIIIHYIQRGYNQNINRRGYCFHM